MGFCGRVLVKSPFRQWAWGFVWLSATAEKGRGSVKEERISVETRKVTDFCCVRRSVGLRSQLVWITTWSTVGSGWSDIGLDLGDDELRDDYFFGGNMVFGGRGDEKG